MKYSSIRVVLVETSHPGNIGASARAMKTMGFLHLYLVAPKVFPHLNAQEMAAGADDVLASAFVVDSLADAIKDCHLVIATSARPRGLDLKGLLPKECAKLVQNQSDDTQVAIIFGRERTGLTNEELLHCHFHVNIPANPDYSSLNLAQAVQIIVYELRMMQLSQQKTEIPLDNPLATMDEIEQFYRHLSEILLAINFLKPKSPGRVQQRIRRLFNRVHLEKMEVNILRGMLSHIQKTIA